MSRICGTLLLGALLALALMVPPAQGQKSGKDPASATSPDGKLLALAMDRTISIHDVLTQKELVRLLGHTDKVTALGFSPDGRLLASGSLDKTIGLWNVPTGQQVRRFVLPAGVVSLSFSQDGKMLTAVGMDQSTRRWDIATGKELSGETE